MQLGGQSWAVKVKGGAARVDGAEEEDDDVLGGFVVEGKEGDEHEVKEAIADLKR